MAELKVVPGDVTRLEVDAIVDAASSSLGWGWVDEAIHRAAGPEVVGGKWENGQQ